MKLIEDVTLCESWVHATHDPITGNEMDKREMWSKITKEFCDWLKIIAKIYAQDSTFKDNDKCR